MFTDADYKAPTLSKVIEFVYGDLYDTTKEKRMIRNEARETGRTEKSTALIERMHGEGFIAEYNAGDYKGYDWKNGRGEGTYRGRTDSKSGSRGVRYGGENGLYDRHEIKKKLPVGEDTSPRALLANTRSVKDAQKIKSGEVSIKKIEVEKAPDKRTLDYLLRWIIDELSESGSVEYAYELVSGLYGQGIVSWHHQKDFYSYDWENGQREGNDGRGADSESGSRGIRHRNKLPVGENSSLRALLANAFEELANTDAEKESMDAVERGDNENPVDISTLNDENGVISNSSRGDQNDNRGIRKGVAEIAGYAEVDGGANTRSVKDTQKNKEWRSLDKEDRNRIKRLVNAHINKSPNNIGRWFVERRS